nr:DNA-directed DNA polymerase [Tanacetum cinerariifolium]
MSSSTPVISSEVAELKDLVRALLLDQKNQSSALVSSSTPALVKVVEPNCVTCGGSGTRPSNTITNPKEELNWVSNTITTLKEELYHYPKWCYLSRTHNSYSVQGCETRNRDALILMPKFASTLKALIGNKEKLSEMARNPMNEHCSAVILNKLPRKLGDPEKFLIPCEFPGMDECLALADLGASINLMPLSIWEALLLSELNPTCMTLELVDRSVSKPIDIAKDVSFKVGMFDFPADFVVVEFEPDLRVSLILRRCFLKTSRALIDVHKGELTLRIRNEAITYNLDQTVSGNSTPYDEPIVSTTSPTLTSFGDSDFLLFEEADAFLGLEDDPDSPKINPFYYDPKGDILLLEAILNSEPLHPFPNHEQYLPSFKKELKSDKKLPVISAKELGDEEKSALIKVLKSHKRAIAWKLSDIHGMNLKFFTHKILMEEDYKPAVQHQRRVNPKIHDILKKEVEKLLDVGLIYLIFDSPWVSPVHCVPKKDGFTIVENEKNELIPTRLVTGWRIPIDPRDQEKTTFTCPYGTFAYRRMPFGFCSAPGTFQRCMLAIFHDMVEKTMEVFMDDFSVFGNSFENCLSRLHKMLQRCEDTNLSLNWENIYFIVKEGVVLGHKISKNRIKVDRAKVNVNAKLPHPTIVKEYSVHFLRRLYQSFLNVEEKTHGSYNLDCPKLGLPFELICNASDFAIGAVLGQRHEKHFRPIHYASKMMNDAESNYITTEKEMLAVVEKFLNEMKCLKIPSKFAKFLTYGASISWGRSHLHEETNIYSWPLITCQNGVKRKRSQPTTPELFANF